MEFLSAIVKAFLHHFPHSFTDYLHISNTFWVKFNVFTYKSFYYVSQVKEILLFLFQHLFCGRIMAVVVVLAIWKPLNLLGNSTGVGPDSGGPFH